MDLDFLGFFVLYSCWISFIVKVFSEKRIPFSLTSSDFLVFIAYNLNPIDAV